VDDRWSILARVRDVRARAALNKLMQERQARARAQAKLQQVMERRMQLEKQAKEASLLVAAATLEAGAEELTAAQIQAILDFADGARVQARQMTIPIQRAQLQYDRTREAVDRASMKYRQEAARKETVHSHWDKMLQASRRLRLERADTNVSEERAGFSVACERQDERHRDSGNPGGEERQL
jgi:hypothetical protein